MFASEPLLLSITSHVWIALSLYIKWSTSISLKIKNAGASACSSYVQVYIVEAVTLVSRIRADNSKAGSLNWQQKGRQRAEVRIHWGILLLGCKGLATSVPCSSIFHDHLLDVFSWEKNNLLWKNASCQTVRPPPSAFCPSPMAGPSSTPGLWDKPELRRDKFKQLCSTLCGSYCLSNPNRTLS